MDVDRVLNMDFGQSVVTGNSNPLLSQVHNGKNRTLPALEGSAGRGTGAGGFSLDSNLTWVPVSEFLTTGDYDGAIACPTHRSSWPSRTQSTQQGKLKLVAHGPTTAAEQYGDPA